jgi:RNA polymerase sigma factor (sigma-70 family)
MDEVDAHLGKSRQHICLGEYRVHPLVGNAIAEEDHGVSVMQMEVLRPSRRTLNPETALLLAERAAALRNALEELPPEYREVLVLRELEQLSYREIAEITGIPFGTVMSRLNRGRQRLQQALLNYAERGAIDAVPYEAAKPWTA